MTILQMIIDEVERRAIMDSWLRRDMSEHDNLTDWPWGLRDDQKDDYRRDVVRALVAVIDKGEP